VIAIGMSLSALATSLSGLIVFRAVTGLGIGSLLPTMAAMAAEFSSEKRRDLSVGFVQAGWPIGAIITGLFAAWLVPEFGWRTVFVGTAAISALMIPIIAFAMPESLEFLSRKQPRNAEARINRLLVKMGHEPLDSFPARSSDNDRKIGIAALFEKDIAPATYLLWAGTFFGFMTLYTLISWIPSIAKQSGMPVEQAIYVGTALNAGAFAGSSLIGWLATWLGLRRLIPLFLIGAVPLMISYASIPMSAVAMFFLIFLIGLTVQGGFNGFYPAAARVYPAASRATGIGWAMGAGRTGAILGPLLAGYLMDGGASTLALFCIFCVPLVISGLAAYFIPAKDLRKP
jgi:MFS family permease